MKRLEKQGLISDLNNVFQKYSSVMVVHYKGLTVAEMESLRKDMSKHDISFKVVKNSLASIATSDTQNTVLNDFFVGPTAIVWGDEPVACAKVLLDFSKKNQSLSIVGGAYNGIKLSVAEVTHLATLPSFDELRGKIVGLLTAAATKLVVVSRTPATNLVGVLSAYSEQK